MQHFQSRKESRYYYNHLYANKNKFLNHFILFIGLGEFQIFMKGVVQFTMVPTPQRQEKFKEYYFTCTCIACLEDWKLDTESKYAVIICYVIHYIHLNKIINFVNFISFQIRLRPWATDEDEIHFTEVLLPAIGTVCDEISKKLQKNDLRQKDNMLRELYAKVAWLYEKVEQPNYVMIQLSCLIETIHIKSSIAFIDNLLDSQKKYSSFSY